MVAKILILDPVNIGGAGVFDVNVSVIYKRSKGGFVDFAPVLVDTYIVLGGIRVVGCVCVALRGAGCVCLLV